MACAPTMVCNSGQCVAPSGIGVLSVPFSDAAQAQDFADWFVEPRNLDGARLTVRAYAPGATSGSLTIYLRDILGRPSSALLQTELSQLSAKWTDLSIPITGAGNFGANVVKQINLDVKAGAGPWATPTIIYIDSVRTSNQAVNDAFDSTTLDLLKSKVVAVPGSALDWVAGVP